MTLTQRLASVYAGITAADLPAATVHAVRRHLLDTLGAMLAGARQPEPEAALQAVRALYGPTGPAGLPGRSERLPAGAAALVNGIAAHALELDDASGCDHSGAVMVPAVLAALEAMETPVDDDALIAAICVGYDLGRRLLEATGGYDAHNGAGWHSTGTLGVYAATAAVARLRGLSPDQMVNALGIAGSMSSGNWSFLVDGSMTKRLHCGLPAMNANLAVEMTLQGFVGPAHVLDAEWGGFFATYARATAQPGLLFDGLGVEWRIHRSSIKPFASCRGTHSAVEIALKMRDQLLAAGVESITIGTNEVVSRMCGNQEVVTLVDAQMSLPYSVAVAWQLGRADLAAFDDASRADPAIQAATRQIRVVHDPEVTTGIAARLTARLRSGETLTARIDIPLGSAGNELPDAALQDKFLSLATPVLGAAQTGALRAAVWSMGGTADPRRICALLHPLAKDQ